MSRRRPGRSSHGNGGGWWKLHCGDWPSPRTPSPSARSAPRWGTSSSSSPSSAATGLAPMRWWPRWREQEPWRAAEASSNRHLWPWFAAAVSASPRLMLDGRIWAEGLQSLHPFICFMQEMGGWTAWRGRLESTGGSTNMSEFGGTSKLKLDWVWWLGLTSSGSQTQPNKDNLLSKE